MVLSLVTKLVYAWSVQVRPGVPVGMGLVVGSGEAVGWGDVEGNGVGTGVEVGVLTNVEDMLYSSSTLLKV